MFGRFWRTKLNGERWDVHVGSQEFKIVKEFKHLEIDGTLAQDRWA